MQFASTREQDALSLEISRIGNATIYRAYRGARFMVVKADTLGAFRRHDVINILRDCGTRRAVELPRHPARVNCRVRTLRLARSAVDTFARDRRRHLCGPRSIAETW